MRIMPMFEWLPMGFFIISASVLILILLVCLLKKSARRLRNFRRIGIVALMLLVVLRPVRIVNSSATNCENTNVFFALELSGEMEKLDFMDGTKRRFEMAALDVLDIAKEFTGAQFSILVGDYKNYLELPLTSDTEALKLSATTLAPTKMGGTDTAAEVSEKAEEEMGAETESGAEREQSFGAYAAERIQTSTKETPERQNYVVLLTDKANWAETSDEVARGLKGRLSGGMVLDYSDNTRTRRADSDEEMVDGRRDTLEYYERGNSYRMSGAPAEQVKELARQARASGNTEYREYYWLLALIILALLIWEFADILDRLLMERRVEYN